ENASCPTCGEHIQTREHIPTTCPAFEDCRNILQSASEDLIVTDIIGTEKGIEALSAFLKETDAFKKSRRSSLYRTNSQPSSIPE
ncbi:hypothetical protein EDD17DRAFT_1464932, partial [Pisolithus thermaeus]